MFKKVWIYFLKFNIPFSSLRKANPPDGRRTRENKLAVLLLVQQIANRQLYKTRDPGPVPRCPGRLLLTTVDMRAYRLAPIDVRKGRLRNSDSRYDRGGWGRTWRGETLIISAPGIPRPSTSAPFHVRLLMLPWERAGAFHLRSAGIFTWFSVECSAFEPGVIFNEYVYARRMVTMGLELKGKSSWFRSLPKSLGRFLRNALQWDFMLLVLKLYFVLHII